MDDLKRRSVSELLALHVDVMDELKARGVLRSANNPTGDLAEHLFCRAFGWSQAGNSSKAFDATDEQGVRYQIKARRLHGRNTSRQLSAIRSPDDFDVLAAVLFDQRFRVLRAALVPTSVVQANSRFTTHTNSHRFLMRDRIWEAEGVEDVTAQLRAVEGTDGAPGP